MVVATDGAGERPRPAGRAFLEKGDVPIGVGEDLAELRQQVAIDLDVGCVFFRDPQEARAPGTQRRVGGSVAPVKEIPADGLKAHRLSMRRLPRHFLTGQELGAFELRSIIERAAELKQGRRSGVGATVLSGRSVGLFFERPSTRTRISFDVGVCLLYTSPSPRDS